LRRAEIQLWASHNSASEPATAEIVRNWMLREAVWI
jgi:hypothetical protein